MSTVSSNGSVGIWRKGGTAGHDLTLLMHFIQRRRNQRSDEYGGSLENRVRLFREVLEETAAGVTSVQAIGDCDVPATIAAAVHDGHRAARELDEAPANPDLPFRREHILLGASV